MYTISDLYDLEHTLAADYLRQFTYPWEALPFIKNKLYEIIEKNLNGYYFLNALSSIAFSAI